MKRRSFFPSETREIQMDEKWNFVRKKEKNCNDDEKNKSGEQWDHVAIDAESKLILSVCHGKRTSKNTEKLVTDVHKRTGGRTDILISTDQYAPYKTSIEKVYGEKVIPKKKQCLGEPPIKAKTVMPEELCYVTVCKEYKKGKISSVRKEIVFGTETKVKDRIKSSKVSKTINTSFIERNNATDRGQNSRKHRETYCFSKDLSIHVFASFLMICLYNFCWCVRTLSLNVDNTNINQTPAMAAKLSDHIWTVEEFMTFPSIQQNELHQQVLDLKYRPINAVLKHDLLSVS